VKVQAVVALKAEHRFSVLLQVAKLARSTFYYHQAQLARPDPRAALKLAIREQVTRAHGRYGHRRIHRELGKMGWQVAKKTVLARMRDLGLVCQVRRRKRLSSYRGASGPTVENTLNRDFTASAPNQKWVTDTTELRIGEEKRYLSPVLDLFDRQIIAYTLGSSPNLAVTTAALRQALATLTSAEQPLVHTDQGF
jgi:putative transposase